MNKNSIQSVIAGEESSKAAATNPSLTQTMIRIILDATIRSSTVDYSCVFKEASQRTITTDIEIKVLNEDIAIRVFKEYSPWRLVIADNKEVYVQYYMPDRKGDDSPMYGFDASSDTSLGRAFINYFDTLFKKSRPA